MQHNTPKENDIFFLKSLSSSVQFSEGKFLIGHFIVVDGSEAEGELVLKQTFLLYYVNQVILMPTSIFQEQFP